MLGAYMQSYVQEKMNDVRDQIKDVRNNMMKY